MESLRLNDISVGERAIVTGFEVGAAGYRSKLLAMGLTPGVTVMLSAVAPLGDPVEMEVRGFHLSLRKAEAEVLKLRRPE